ncbi:hypothetical protein [Brevibacterium marinum]|uniref:Protein kinase n=1 Tax=Brevibacterium marinum TaxID=418643 RepID=A0A846S2C4_9MICO|nr:hypothetical protein [Brevibacterium marinum]NJC55722.1 hypothetical protein [Brevibacterium marinum]
MSVNPPPPGSGRDNERNGDNQQSHWPNPSGHPSGNGWNQQPESGWDQQSDTGWGQSGWGPPQSNNGWGGGSAAGPPPPQYPRPKRPQSDALQAQAAQGQGAQGQAAYAQYAQGPYAAAPATKPRSRKGLIALGAVLIIFVGLGIGWGAATLFGNSSDEDTVAAPASSEAKSPSDEASSSQGPSESPEASESPTLPGDPAEALDQLVDTDRPSVKSDLNGKWVPQLSSKKLGLEAEGKTWEEKDILAEHQELREEFPRVQLVWSGDFSSFKENDFWVTIVGIGYDDPEEALSWCSAHGLGADYCYAKQLNTSGGTEGTTRLQD